MADTGCHEEEKDFAYTLRSVAWELIVPFGHLSRRGLKPIKPVYDPDRPDGRLNLTASAFNQLGQYTSSPGTGTWTWTWTWTWTKQTNDCRGAWICIRGQIFCGYPQKLADTDTGWINCDFFNQLTQVLCNMN